jgi:hypothetical protein
MRNVFLTISLILLVAFTCLAGEKQKQPPSKYQRIEVMAFEVDPTVKDLPADFQGKFMPQVIKDIEKTKRFAVVVQPSGEPTNVLDAKTSSGNPDTAKLGMAFVEPSVKSAPQPENSTERVLLLTGKIVEFDPGSRGKRYLGFGGGAATVVAHVKFTDKTDQTVLFERDLSGKLVAGAFGGSASDAAYELAREIARTVKKQAF